MSMNGNGHLIGLEVFCTYIRGQLDEINFMIQIVENDLNNLHVHLQEAKRNYYDAQDEDERGHYLITVRYYK